MHRVLRNRAASRPASRQTQWHGGGSRWAHPAGPAQADALVAQAAGGVVQGRTVLVLGDVVALRACLHSKGGQYADQETHK